MFVVRKSPFPLADGVIFMLIEARQAVKWVKTSVRQAAA